MKKKEKTVCQIIRFRGKIETFFVSIDEFASSTILCNICYRRHIPASVKERALAESVAQVHRRVPVHVLPTHVSVYTCHVIHVHLRGEVRPRLHQLPDQPLPQLRAAHPSSRALGHRVS